MLNSAPSVLICLDELRPERKRINGYTYLYLVETVREDGRAKQRIIKNLGRKEALAAALSRERFLLAASGTAAPRA